MPRVEEKQETRKQVTPDALLQLGMGFWGSKTLLSAIGLGLFTEVAKGPQDAESLRKRLGLHERSARDFFDALVALGMLRRENGKYSNTPETALFLDKAKPSYVGGIFEMCDRRLFGFWNDLTEGLKTGNPQNEIKHGREGLFDVIYKDPAKLKEFLRAMTGISMGAAHAIADKFPWKDYKTFVDVGTAQGCLPVVVATAHGHLKGFGADLPVVEPIFSEYVREAGLSDRVEFKPLDFFKEPLPKADVFIMGHILHDWNLEEKRQLIRKAYEALPDEGAFIVYESIIDNDRSKDAFGLLMSLNMLIETKGGFDYTGADCSGWMKEAGFKQMRIEHLMGPDSMVIGIR